MSKRSSGRSSTDLSRISTHLARQATHETMRSLLLAIALLSLPASAGDYLLFIADDAACERPKAASDLYSSPEVVADLDRYFSGSDPQIGIFRAAFTNARIQFCGSTERAAIQGALVSWAVRGPSARESHLIDFFLMLGSNQVVAELDALIASAGSPETRRRLQRAREAAARGVALRSG